MTTQATNWKQNTVPKYLATHRWVYKNFGKASMCENDPAHTAKRFEWSNISGEYRRDPSDWRQLCPSCHRKVDITDEFRKRMSLVLRGNKNSCKPIMQLTRTGDSINLYSSTTEAAIKNNLLRTSIVNVLRGDTQTAGGYKWQYL